MIFERLRKGWMAFKAATLDNSPPWLRRAFGARMSDTGEAISDHAAMCESTVFACVKVIAETLGSMPFKVYERTPSGKNPAETHPLYYILHDAPNPEMTAMQWREVMAAHVCYRGRAYSEIVRDENGNVSALWPLHPDFVTLKRDKKSKQLFYSIRNPDGTTAILPYADVLPILHFGPDRFHPLSPIAAANNNIALSLAAEKYAARYFKNDANPGGILEHPGSLSDAAYARLEKSVEKKTRGLDNKHRMMILEEGMKWNKLQLSPEDSQLLETRKATVPQIARYFRMPLHKIQDLDRSTNNNIEHQGIEFVTDTMTPWCCRFEQPINMMLFPKGGQFFAEYLTDGLLRGDIKTRYEAYAIGRQWGWLSANDIRRKENMNDLPAEQGNQYLVPLNMIPATIPAKRMPAEIASKYLEYLERSEDEHQN